MSWATCPGCGEDIDLAGVVDDDALIDFVGALLAGDMVSARALVGRAFIGEDLARIERMFARQRAGTQAMQVAA